MAKASPRKVSVPVTRMEEKLDGVVLELTQDEAQFVVDLLGAVGGSPTGSRRRHADAVDAALRKAGVIRAYGGPDDKRGAVYFL